jgi:hypothetical protein
MRRSRCWPGYAVMHKLCFKSLGSLDNGWPMGHVLFLLMLVVPVNVE